MTIKELKEHCETQIQQFERVKELMPVTLNDWKRYEEHKLILELLEQETVPKEIYDYEYFLRKEFELKIDKLQRQLDKIRTEIKAYADHAKDEKQAIAFKSCLNAIDYYTRAESEDKE